MQENDFLFDLALQARDDPEPPKLDKESFLEILGNAGVSAEKLETFPACFEDKVEASHTDKLTISNITESKINLNTSYVSVSIDRSDVGKVRTSVQNGRRCLVIDLDEPSLLVNGMPVTL